MILKKEHETIENIKYGYKILVSKDAKNFSDIKTIEKIELIECSISKDDYKKIMN